MGHILIGTIFFLSSLTARSTHTTMLCSALLEEVLYPGRTLARFHLLFYSVLLGMEIYQTFGMTKLSHQALPKTAFRSLQKRVFPVYFRAQTILLLLTALKFPPHGPGSLIEEKTHLLAFCTAGVMAGLNLIVYGPATQAAMIAKTHHGMLAVDSPARPLDDKRSSGSGADTE